MDNTANIKTPTLYALSEELQKALDGFYVDEETGELVGFDELAAVKAEFEEKAEAVAVAVKGAEAFAEAIKAERDRLDRRQKAAEKKAERLKVYLADMMNKVGMEKFQSVRAQVSFRTSEALIITDEDAIPAELGSFGDWKPDKTAIKKAIKSGQQIPGAAIEKRRNIQIR